MRDGREDETRAVKFNPDKHIIFIGFKHVGKSVIGRSLALRMGKMHIDLDREIERLYEIEYQNRLNCREIFRQKGGDLFRRLEHQALKEVIQSAPCVISLGGSTPMFEENRRLIEPHCVVYLTAPMIQVFKRIMSKGRPAFFPLDEDPWITFSRLWREREKVYKQLATFTIANHGSMAFTMKQLIENLGL